VGCEKLARLNLNPCTIVVMAPVVKRKYNLRPRPSNGKRAKVDWKGRAKRAIASGALTALGGPSAGVAFNVANSWAQTTKTGKMRRKAAVGKKRIPFRRKAKAKYRVRRKGVQFNADKYGMSLSFETGGVLTDPYCVYVGHGTCPAKVIRRILFGALLKKMLVYIKMMPESLTEPLEGFAGTNTFRIFYRTGYDSAATALSNFAYNVAAADTFQLVLDGLINAYVIARQGSASPNIEWFFTRFDFVPDVGNLDLAYCRINLMDAKFCFYSSSTLKMQNRTSTGTDDDANDVDNQPLEGRIYDCHGSGTFTRRQTALATKNILNMFVNRTSGVYNEVSNNVNNPVEFREPPKPWHYSNVWKSGGVKISPGELRTSYLKSRYTMNLNTIMKLLLENTEKVGLAALDFTTLGKSRFFSLEKMLETLNDGTTPTQLISLAFEGNFNCGGYMITKREYVTTQEVYTGGTLPN